MGIPDEIIYLVEAARYRDQDERTKQEAEERLIKIRDYINDALIDTCARCGRKLGEGVMPTVLEPERIFSLSANNKGLPCPFRPPILCQEGYCFDCQIYLDLQKLGEMVIMCAWCGKVTGRKFGFGVVGVSHGICPECEKKYFPETVIQP